MSVQQKDIEEQMDIEKEIDIEKGLTSKRSSIRQKLLAEAIGTFIIVHLGCGSVCTFIYRSAQMGIWQISAVWTIAVTLAIYTSAKISGGHLNPSISIAMKLCRSHGSKGSDNSMGWAELCGYCGAQMVGAILGAAVNFALFYESIAEYESLNNIVRGTPDSVASAAGFGEYWSVSSWKLAFFGEFFGTFILSFMIFSLTNERNDSVSKDFAPVLIGSTVGALISVIGPLTQGGFNPARDFGPRIVAWLGGWGIEVAMQGWWVYMFAPTLGACCGGLLSEKILWKGWD